MFLAISFDSYTLPYGCDQSHSFVTLSHQRYTFAGFIDVGGKRGHGETLLSRRPRSWVGRAETHLAIGTFARSADQGNQGYQDGGHQGSCAISR
jgi:hypothetical protein